MIIEIRDNGNKTWTLYIDGDSEKDHCHNPINLMKQVFRDYGLRVWLTSKDFKTLTAIK